MTSKTLYQKTKEMAGTPGLAVVEVARGAGVGLRWLQRFRAGHIQHPSVHRVQRLHDYLRKKRRNGA